jgi:hypothetical protein
MFRLDYLSCFLTILATVLVGRKSWTGLLISIVNSLIVCVIGFRTSQFGFIPANLICICVYAFSIRSWLKKTHKRRIRNLPSCGGSVPNSLVMSRICTSRPVTFMSATSEFSKGAVVPTPALFISGCVRDGEGNHDRLSTNQRSS